MDISDIREARERIGDHVRRTPLERSETLSRRFGTNVFVKYELFQKTGSFKPRGAFNKLLSTPAEQRAHGTVAVSGGNHAQAVAYASRTLGLDAVIAMPESTPQNYLEATRGYGATTDLCPNIAEAFERAHSYQAKGRVLLHPFDDPLIMAGQGTVGLEILEDVPDVTDVIVSIGGGGLAGGVATAVKAANPRVRIWGVETVGADAMAQAMAAGHPVELPAITSIAKTLGAPYVSQATLDLANRYLESVTVVPDTEAVREMVFIAERLKVLAEPSTSCNIAAMEHLRENFRPSNNVVVIFCGGNVSVSDLCGFRKTFSV